MRAELLQAAPQADKNEKLVEIQELDYGEQPPKIIKTSSPARQMEVDKSFDNPRKDLNRIDIRKNRTSPADLKAKAFRIEARDIILQPFISNEPTLTSQESKERDFLNAHLSTPSFIKTLTDLADDVMTYQTMQEKKIFLKQ